MSPRTISTSRSSADRPSPGRSARSSRGGRASAWLPKDKGIAALAEYGLVQRAHIVFVPESLDSMDELRPLLASSGDADTTRPAIEIHVVSAPDSAVCLLYTS